MSERQNDEISSKLRAIDMELSPGCAVWIEDEIDELIEAKRLERDAIPQSVQN